MLPADLPDDTRLLELLEHRETPSASIALESSPLPADHERIRIALRGAIDRVARELEELDLPHDSRDELIERLRRPVGDDEFWAHQSRAILVLASPRSLEAFRLPVAVRDVVAVSDRFDVTPLLHAASQARHAFVLQLSQRLARLTELTPDGELVEHPLDLPDDHDSILQQAENDGQLDRDRAQGTTGDRLERERFCAVVDREVSRIVPERLPLVLAVADDLLPAYRSANTHAALVEESIQAHPESLDDQRLTAEAGRILDEVRRAEIDEWKDEFGTWRAAGLATSRLKEVAAAAAAAAIEELRFDVDADAAGSVDEYGRVVEAGEGGTAGSPLVNELAARVLAGGGRVRGVRRSELIDGSPVAARLRFAVQVPA